MSQTLTVSSRFVSIEHNSYWLRRQPVISTIGGSVVSSTRGIGFSNRAWRTRGLVSVTGALVPEALVPPFVPSAGLKRDSVDELLSCLYVDGGCVEDPAGGSEGVEVSGIGCHELLNEGAQEAQPVTLLADGT